MGPTRALIKPRTLAPCFVLVGLVHAAAVASRFDAVAAKLPPGAPLAIMFAQFPLLYLSGYFETRLEHDSRSPNRSPLWMRSDSRAVMFCFAFGFMYLVVVAAQTWSVGVGPLDPTPPASFPGWQRAMWFALFTGGAFMLFYMAAGRFLVPVLRVLVWPLAFLPTIVAAVLALAIGGGLGLVVLAAVQSQGLVAHVKALERAVATSPALFVAVVVAATVGPMLLGLLLQRERAE